jgi:hypothetical protein
VSVRALARLSVLLLPLALLFLGILRTAGVPQVVLALGALLQILVCYLILKDGAWHSTLGPSVVTLYLTALGWLWMALGDQLDWYCHFSRAVFLLVPLFVFSAHVLANTRSSARWLSRLAAQNLAKRRDWPTDLFACRNLPEVKKLREAAQIDAGPALALLEHHLLPVRVAALTALEFRQDWRTSQAEYVLRVGQKTNAESLRAASASALANVDDRRIIEQMSEWLHDPSPAVRSATAEALLWDAEHRWSWTRLALRRALADPANALDGPLFCNGRMLPPDGVADLRAWSCEKGTLGIRSAQSLAVHYGQVLQQILEPALIDELRQMVTDTHSAPPLRIELGLLLRNRGLWDELLPDTLLEPSNPAPLRLMAIEALLASGPNPEALRALYEIACFPNREIALATADLAQRCLGIDLGLTPGKPLPPLNSRQAAEITRRVMHWAASERAKCCEPAPV